MNPRMIFMRYVGWCPGISAAARFVPDREIPKRWIALSVAVPFLILMSIGYYLLSIPIPAGPLAVTIDGTVYSDDVFTANFNYSVIVGKRITFFEPLNRSELYDEKFSFEVESLDEVWSLLDELNMPNVTRMLAKMLLNGTYEDAVTFFKADREFGVYLSMGDPPRGSYVSNAYVWYHLERYPMTPTNTEEITIRKEYYTGSGFRSVWNIWIKVYEYPPHKVDFWRSEPNTNIYSVG